MKQASADPRASMHFSAALLPQKIANFKKNQQNRWNYPKYLTLNESFLHKYDSKPHLGWSMFTQLPKLPKQLKLTLLQPTFFLIVKSDNDFTFSIRSIWNPAKTDAHFDRCRDLSTKIINKILSDHATEHTRIVCERWKKGCFLNGQQFFQNFWTGINASNLHDKTLIMANFDYIFSSKSLLNT